MIDTLRRFLFLAFAASTASAIAESWVQPTPDELKMTAEAAVPGAAAVYLYREERADDKLHVHTVYVRVKILTEKGKSYADVEIPYEGRSFSVRAVEGRTIHSDGTVIPFTGKPYQKMIEKTKTSKYEAKVFSLPDAQVGSILEYRYEVTYDDDWVYSPQWLIQQPLYVRKAHYQFLPTEHRLNDNHGGTMEAGLAYWPLLPKGAEVRYLPTQRNYLLDVEKIEPIPEEEYMPPMQSLSYRVLFYYTAAHTADEYWKTEGKYWSKDIDRFMSVNKLAPVAAQIVAPADTPRQKTAKIYEAVMKLENTSFTRGHSGEEDKAQGIKIKTAADTWEAKRGNADEIAILFVGIARAAGLHAYVGAVTNRNRALFVPSYLSMSQLDDDIAIVELDGKDQFFDPGQRYCSFGELHWKHTISEGLRQTEHGAELVQTPSPGYKSTTVLRTADLHLEADGKVHGNLHITMTGSRALSWRQLALANDLDEIKKRFEDSIQPDMPSGIQVKTNHFLELDGSNKVLIAVLDVTGSMGTATAKRVLLPATFFEAGSRPLFVHSTRTVPVDLDYPYAEQDTVVLHLAPSFAIESTPKNAEIPLPKNALYQATFKQEPGKLEMDRIFILANSVYPTAEYEELKNFYQKVNAKDQEQAILKFTGAEATPAAVSGGSR